LRSEKQKDSSCFGTPSIDLANIAETSSHANHLNNGCIFKASTGDQAGVTARPSLAKAGRRFGEFANRRCS
jgi:hypothetical protein